MTTDRKKPGVGFWVKLAAVVLPVCYVLSIGPASWFVNHHAGHEYLVVAYFIFYSPILLLYLYGPQPFRDALDWYVELWS